MASLTIGTKLDAAGVVVVPATLGKSWRIARRQPNTCCEQICHRRATSDTRAPGTNVSATIRAFSSADQRRRRPGPVRTSTRRNSPFASSLTSNIRIARSPLPQAYQALRQSPLNKGIRGPLTLYRQAQMFKRQGITLDRSTLSAWVGRACWWLMPLYELVLGTVLSSDKVFADETTLPVLDPGRGKTKTGQLWCYAVDDRPWAGPTHPAVAYVYCDGRHGEHPIAHLAAFQGILQVDGYAGYGKLVKARTDGSIQLAYCWAHARRLFYEFYTSTQSPLAAEVLARIAKLYEIEAEVRGQPADVRRAI